MVRINLLPWREKKRKILQVRFAIMLGIGLGCTAILMLLVHLYMTHLVSLQEERNTYLQTEITESQNRLNDLKSQKEKQMSLQAQIRFVIDLRAKGFQAVHLLEVLASNIPQGLTLEKIARIQHMIFISGKATSDLEITQYMKSIASEPQFSNTDLTEISTDKDSKTDERHFLMKVQQEGQ